MKEGTLHVRPRVATNLLDPKRLSFPLRAGMGRMLAWYDQM